MTKTRVCLACGVFILVANAAWGQFGGRNRIRQNYDVPQTEFIFARWQYESSSGWNHDYPNAEEHINQIMSEATGLDVEKMSYKIVPIASDEIFNYPFAYVSEPGMMYLSDEEARYFREF